MKRLLYSTHYDGPAHSSPEGGSDVDIIDTTCGVALYHWQFAHSKSRRRCKSCLRAERKRKAK